MNSKFTTTDSITQQLPAGVALNDHNIEFVATKQKTVIWLKEGQAHPFGELPKSHLNALLELYLSDEEATKILPRWYPNDARNMLRMVELYTYYMYGQLDSSPDIKNGKLQTCENFRETTDCISLRFKHKYINIGGVHLSPRDLQIIDDIYQDLPDKMIADRLGIAQSTLDFHKRNLFNLIGASTKTDALKISFKHQVVC